MGYIKSGDYNNQRLVEPRWNGEGQKVMKAVALTGLTEKYPYNLVVTSSGLGVAALATGSQEVQKLAFATETITSGSETEVIIAGYVDAASINSTSAQSTFTAGSAVRISSGYVYSSGGTTMGDWALARESTTTGNNFVGISLSSGETYTVDLYMFDKNYYVTT